jgi:hypothetical protein
MTDIEREPKARAAVFGLRSEGARNERPSDRATERRGRKRWVQRAGGECGKYSRGQLQIVT